MISDKEISAKTISSALCTLKNTMSDIITPFHKKSYDISDDAKKFHAGMSNKTNDAQTKLDTRINKINKNIERSTVDNTDSLCNHAKHMCSQHEALTDKKIAAEDLLDNIIVMKSENSKTINDMQSELNKAKKSGSINHTSPYEKMETFASQIPQCKSVRLPP